MNNRRYRVYLAQPSKRSRRGVDDKLTSPQRRRIKHRYRRDLTAWKRK